jgi:hypothetical protein
MKQANGMDESMSDMDAEFVDKPPDNTFFWATNVPSVRIRGFQRGDIAFGHGVILLLSTGLRKLMKEYLSPVVGGHSLHALSPDPLRDIGGSACLVLLVIDLRLVPWLLCYTTDIPI